MKLMVIDDSATDRQFLVGLLQKMGHEVDATQTTQGALDQIAAGQYSAVFLDIVMPEQDGYKFLRSLRSNPATAQQKVIFCSSKKTPLEIDYGLKRAGADRYITKPVTTESLMLTLQAI